MTNESKQVQRYSKVEGRYSVNEKDEIIARGLALSPLDGKRAEVAEAFSPYFSDFAWLRNMVKVEAEWLVCYILTVEDEAKLEAELGLDEDESDRFCETLELIRKGFDTRTYARVKVQPEALKAPAEATSQHIRTVLIQEHFSKLGSFVQIGCTEEQIENAAYSLMIKDVLEELWKPAAEALIKTMEELKGRDKKLDEYAKALKECVRIVLDEKPCMSSGFGVLISKNFPKIDWEKYVEKEFAENYLGLVYNPDRELSMYVNELLNGVMRFNTMLNQMNHELYLYRAQDYYISNWLFEGIVDGMSSDTDLTPTSLLWNVGEAFAYSREAIRNTIQGLREEYK